MRFFILLLLSSFAASAQQTSRLHNQDAADRFVTYFLGDKIFRQYVSPDLKQSHSSAGKTFFLYYFRHPKFSGETFVIAFTLDSNGHFIPGKETRGIVKIDSVNDSQWIDARSALATCRDQGQVKKKTLRLAWDSTGVSYDNYLKTGNLSDIFPGGIGWLIDGNVNFRGDKYSGTFEVDIFTGKVFRRFAIPWD